MSRKIAGLLVAGLATLVLGLVLAASQWGVALVVIGAVLLAVFYVLATVKAVRTKGFTWDVNPGAARREAAREREAARKREASQPKDE